MTPSSQTPVEIRTKASSKAASTTSTSTLSTTCQHASSLNAATYSIGSIVPASETTMQSLTYSPKNAHKKIPLEFKNRKSLPLLQKSSRLFTNSSLFSKKYQQFKSLFLKVWRMILHEESKFLNGTLMNSFKSCNHISNHKHNFNHVQKFTKKKCKAFIVSMRTWKRTKKTLTHILTVRFPKRRQHSFHRVW